MQIEFTKMHGLGNDFVVIDAINQGIDLSTEQIKWIANRRFGVGCDQLLLVESPDRDDVEFRYRIFNADGGEVEQCGNGARCFARFVQDQGLTSSTHIPVSTNTGKIVLQLMDNDLVQVNMGVPQLAPDKIPFVSEQQETVYTLESEMLGKAQDCDSKARNYELGVVSMGNPHAVLLVDDIDKAPLETVGAEIEMHSRFPNRVNVGFMQVIDEAAIRLRVYERGVGETLACGTGACAAVVSGRLRGILADHVIVSLPGGNLDIAWQGINKPVYMIGSAETAFKGSMTL